MGRPPNRPEDMWKHVAKGPGCWLWLGAKNLAGYGVFSVKLTDRATHRLAWELTNGPIPAGLFVCHSCDMPACCNPAHLFLGTASENQWDASRKGRKNSPRGSGHHAAKLDELMVGEIRRRHGLGERGKDLAKAFGVAPARISEILSGQAWRHA